ncbi:unnamed protein product, partial [Phaeothamnion confervicola]
HFSNWWSVLDALVVAAGFPLTLVMAGPDAGAMVLGCRVVRAAAAVQGRMAAMAREEASERTEKDYEAPAVQLYQLMMRTIRSNCNIFSVEEKGKLRQLM